VNRVVRNDRHLTVGKIRRLTEQTERNCEVDFGHITKKRENLCKNGTETSQA